jgi:predicted RNA-binding Zn-ribbon protein involved in translation (DUF1610 family)
MKRFTFPVALSGVGKDMETAWRDAVEQFTLDPGEPDSAEIETEPFNEEERAAESNPGSTMAVPVRCPRKRRRRGDLVGCGSSNLDGPDDEGFYDCQDCGLFFSAQGMKQPAGISRPVDPPWTDQDAEDSIAQGWSIFAVPERDPGDEMRVGDDGKPYGRRLFELMFVQDPPDGGEPTFADDGEAWEFVKAQVAAGDALATRAAEFLRVHSPREYEAIFGEETPAAVAQIVSSQDTYQCPNCDWRGDGAVPAWNVLARHLPGDVFSDLECPECGALVQPVPAGDSPPLKRSVAILVYEHKRRQVWAFGSCRKAEAELAKIVREQWEDRADRTASDDPAELPDEAVIDAYFDGNENESYAIEEILVEFES